MPSRAEYFDRWAVLHGGYDPRGSALVALWLGWTHTVAAPLVRARVAPDVVTVGGLLLSAAAVPMAAAGDGWPLGAALLVVASGLSDNLDGAVAVMTDRATRWGYVLDSSCDRVGDGLFLVALWAAGAPGGLCVLGGALMALQEYVRARAGAAGMTEVGVVTVWERPTRVIVTAVALAATPALPLAGVAAVLGAVLGAAAWVGLGVVGLLQLGVAVRRRLR